MISLANLRKFLIQRIIILPISLFFLITVIFIILRVIPGANPIKVINSQLPAAQVQRISEQLGLNKPLFDQYIQFIQDLFTLNLGISIATNTPVIQEIAPRFAATLELTIYACLIGIPLGILVGAYAGRFRETKRDQLLRIYSIAVFSIPIFWLGINMQIVFSKILLALPNSNQGWISPNLRVSPILSPDINKVTGIYSLDSLIFTGPKGYDFLYSFFILCIFVSTMIAYVNYARKNNLQINSKKVIQLTVIFFLSLFFLYISFYFNWNDLPIFSDFPTIIGAIRIFGFIICWGIWFNILTIFPPDMRREFRRIWIYGFIIAAIPTFYYLLQGWTGTSFLNNSYSNYPGILLFQDVLNHMILPSLALGMLLSGVIARLVRTNMISTLNEQYIDASKSRGIPERKITYSYALKNATVPSIPLIGLQFAALLGGAILTETTFSYEGLGLYIFNALNSKDYPQIQGAVILFAFLVSIVSILTDIIYAMLDPRIRL